VMPSLIAAAKPIARLDFRARALAIWPGIDPRKLRRTQGDPLRIARLVERRTRLPIESIVSLLTGHPVEGVPEVNAEFQGLTRG
jgi:hypothetical protein